MSLRDLLDLDAEPITNRRRQLYEAYGVLENPFPPPSQTMGHPHMQTAADDIAVVRLRSFIRDNTSQAIVVQGTQGTGKTNFLEYYKNGLADRYSNSVGVHIVRYYSDPEPDFGAVVRSILQEFGTAHLLRVASALRHYSVQDSEDTLKTIQNHELRGAFTRLAGASDEYGEELAGLLLEYLLGLRLLKRHTEKLGVRFRLDTTESKTQALHDLVYFSHKLGCFKELYLFMDELEKQGAQPTAVVVRYLLAIRALIDALPKFLFLLLAMTPDARRRYAEMVPALSDRLEQVINLRPVMTSEDAERLYNFYVDEKRALARAEPEVHDWTAGTRQALDKRDIVAIYQSLNPTSTPARTTGVTQRSLLAGFHREAESRFLAI